MLKRTGVFFVMTFIFAFSMSATYAEDLKTAPSAASQEKIQRLEAEVQQLTEELAAIENEAQEKIRELEEEVRYLQGVIADIRARIGNGGPAPSAAYE